MRHTCWESKLIGTGKAREIPGEHLGAWTKSGEGGMAYIFGENHYLEFIFV